MSRDWNPTEPAAPAPTADYLTSTLAMLSSDVWEPDEMARNWAKWLRPDGGCIIFRAQPRGDFGTLDVYWREDDGQVNSLFSPVSYDSIARLERDLLRLFAVTDVRPPRDLLARLGKSEVLS